MRMAGAEAEGEVDDVGGRDALVGRETCFESDGIEDPVAYLGRSEVFP
jgi:hypothetical protein